MHQAPNGWKKIHALPAEESVFSGVKTSVNRNKTDKSIAEAKWLEMTMKKCLLWKWNDFYHRKNATCALPRRKEVFFASFLLWSNPSVCFQTIDSHCTFTQCWMLNAHVSCLYAKAKDIKNPPKLQNFSSMYASKKKKSLQISIIFVETTAEWNWRKNAVSS